MLGDGDYEAMTTTELAAFCIGGKVTSIECVTESGIASYSSGEKLTCDLNDGLSCRNSDNAPIPCSDYKVRYYCQCQGEFSEYF